MILSGELKPGQKLKQEQLAEQLGVSRTPLLQASSRLAKDRLVTIIPRRGMIVRKIGVKEKLDVFDARTSLEPLCAEMASETITDEELDCLVHIVDNQERLFKEGKIDESFQEDCHFHKMLVECSRNTYIYDFIKMIVNTQLSTERLLKSPEDSIRDHRIIISALKNHESYSARSSMVMHLDRGAREILEERLLEEERELNAAD